MLTISVEMIDVITLQHVVTKCKLPETQSCPISTASATTHQSVRRHQASIVPSFVSDLSLPASFEPTPSLRIELITLGRAVAYGSLTNALSKARNILNQRHSAFSQRGYFEYLRFDGGGVRRMVEG